MLNSKDSNEEIKKYIKDNPKYLTGNYRELADHFNINFERARSIAKRLRKKLKKADELNKLCSDISDKVTEKIQTSLFKENTVTGEANISFTTPKRIKTKEDLIESGMLDLQEFEIVSYEVTTWEGYRKGKEGNITWTGGVMDGHMHDSGRLITETLYRVNVKLKRRNLDTDLQKQKELILAEIKSQIPLTDEDLWKRFSTFVTRIIDSNISGNKHLLEICLFDPHFGKLAWSEETGESYDLKIAEERFKQAILEILSRVDLTNIERILLPLGNDFINVDNKFNTTTAGTPQDSDSRFFKIIKVVKRVLVEVINELSLIAPVDVLIVPGNHDESTSFFMGEILDAFYHNNPMVTIDCAPRMRKYYQYGANGIQFSHGDQEKHGDLGLIFATEKPELWSNTEFRFCQLGHFHKNKKTEFVSVDDHQGFQVQILPSLSGRDAWHFKKGYHTKKQAKAFLFHKEKGIIAEYTVTV